MFDSRHNQNQEKKNKLFNTLFWDKLINTLFVTGVSLIVIMIALKWFGLLD